MVEPGARNLISDVDGIQVGNAADPTIRTGATVVLPDAPVVAGVDVRGGAPGTRETAALDPSCLVEKIDAIVLSGGSVFGLDAAGGVTQWLAARDRGFPVGGFRAPIVPAAILQDLTNGGDKDWGDEPPYRRLGIQAADAAAAGFALGNAGAGFGARAGRLKGGLGSVSAVDGEIQVGALVAANPLGEVTMADSATFWAWPFEQAGEFGGRAQGVALAGRAADRELALAADSRLGCHTTIGVVATNVMLDKAAARRIAIMAHDGLARAIRPVHTPLDGDTIFAVSTGQIPLAEPAPLALAQLGSLAADCVARAVARAVFEAESLGDMPSYRSLHVGASADA